MSATPEIQGAGFILYNAPTSTCSQKVRLLLAEKGLAWEDRTINFSRNEHLEDWYVKLNPNAVVPTLVHGDRVVIDSSVINEYLEELHPQTSPLVPSDAYERARMRAWRQYIDEVPTPAIRVPSFNGYILPMWSKLSDAEFDSLIERRSIRKHFYRRMGRQGFSAAEVQDAHERLRDTVERMDRSLASGLWLVGTQYTLADVSLVPLLVRLYDIGLASLWQDLPRVEDWFRRVQARPAFTKTFYTGTRYGAKGRHPAMDLAKS